jgi:amino acid transporter
MLFCLTYTVQITAPGLIIPYYAGYGNFVGNFWLGLAIGLAAAFLINSVYAHFSSAMPRSGGDYVFLGRTIHPIVGFVPNWAWIWVASFWNAANLLFFAQIVQLFLSGFYSPDVLAFWYTPMGTFLMGSILFIIGLTAFWGMKWFVNLQYVTWIISLVALIVTTYFILSATGNFPALFNAWALKYVPTEPDMYHKIINDAVAAGFNLNPPPEGPMMERTLAWAVTLIAQTVPYTAGIVYIAGEVKKAESGLRQHIAMEVATLLTAVVWLAVGLTWLIMADTKFMAAFYYLGGSVSGLPVSFYYWTLFPAIMPAWAINLYVVAGLTIYIMVYMAGITVVSRCLFAWSFDRMIPSFFARVSDRWKTPTTALATALLISLILFMMEVNVNIWTYIGAAAFWVQINLFIVCFAGMIFPFVRKDMFEQMPLKARIAGIPVFSIISFFALVLISWACTSYFTNPDFMASFGITQTMVVVSVLVWGLGFAIYFISRAVNKKRGVDLGIAFKQIPPA